MLGERKKPWKAVGEVEAANAPEELGERGKVMPGEGLALKLGATSAAPVKEELAATGVKKAGPLCVRAPVAEKVAAAAEPAASSDDLRVALGEGNKVTLTAAFLHCPALQAQPAAHTALELSCVHSAPLPACTAPPLVRCCHRVAESAAPPLAPQGATRVEAALVMVKTAPGAQAA